MRKAFGLFVILIVMSVATAAFAESGSILPQRGKYRPMESGTILPQSVNGGITIL